MNILPLPQHINLLRMSEHPVQFQGSLLIKDMQRLVLSLASTEGRVDVSLMLDSDTEGTRFCRVKLKAEVFLQCQRCMEPYSYEIISDFLQGIVNSESEADELPEQYEPVLAKDGMLVIQDLVEDELILKLPIVPMHEAAECKVRLPLADSTWNSEVEEEKQNPFNVLKFLKRESK
jgi:uncharacterized protein